MGLGTLFEVMSNPNEMESLRPYRDAELVDLDILALVFIIVVDAPDDLTVGNTLIRGQHRVAESSMSTSSIGFGI